MKQDTWPNLVTMFFEQAARLSDRPFLWRKREGRWAPLSWREVARRVETLASGLRGQGIGRGDRVVLVSENRPAWLIADLAVMALGAISVPAYTTNGEADHLHILEDSGACAAIVSTRRLAQRLLPAVMRCSRVRLVLSIDALHLEQRPDANIVTWQAMMARGEAERMFVRSEARSLSRSDTACLIYTSGTGGAPKGVMLHHGAILSNVAAAVEVFSVLDIRDEVFLSCLPLSHAYEHTHGQFTPIAVGAEIYYAEGADRIAANMMEVRPSIVIAVPRLFEVIHQRILHGVHREGGLRRRLFQAAVALGRRRYGRPDGLGLGERLADFVLDRLVRRKVRDRFGGRLKALVSGGAPLNADVGVFLRALGLPLFQGYGQTEAAPLISVNHPLRPRLDTVGPPIPGADVRIAEDGEILVRGEMVMQGYWRNEQATGQAIRDGWLHTGDVGEIDALGNLRITDRKKDLIVNSGGDNISPARIEGLLALRPEIAQAVVWGDGRPHLVALLVPEGEWLKGWARGTGKPADLAQVSSDPDLLKALGGIVDQVNRTLAAHERVRRFAIVPAPFTMENEQLTPTLKIRRHVIGKVYAATLEGLYA